MKKLLLSLSIIFLSFQSFSQCVDPSLIDSFALCPLIFAPVCGCDGNTYNNDCVAQSLGGVTSWTDGPCSATGGCEAAFTANMLGADLLLGDASFYPAGDLPIGWTWDLPDGSTVEGPIASWTPPVTGEYNFCLTITTLLGCTSTACENVFVELGGGVCEANFNYDFLLGDVILSDTSMVELPDLPTSWSWSISDGTSLDGFIAIWTPEGPGEYEVCLTIGTLLGCTSMYCETIVISDDDCVDESLIDSLVICPLIFDPVCGCDGVTYDNTCYATNYGGVTSWTPGICSDTLCLAGFTLAFEPPIPTEVSFFDNSVVTATEIVSWFWDFGDGGSSTEMDPVHTYTSAGTYTVCLTITAASGCSDTFCSDLELLDSDCTAAYSFADPVDLGGGSYEVSFSDDSDGSIVSWTWDFGDGGTSSMENPTYIYTSSGDYTVCLTVVDDTGVCVDDTCMVVSISGDPGCIDSTIIDLAFPCPTDYIPVCGCDSITYGNACKAENWYGNTSWTDGECLTGIEEFTSGFSEVIIFPNPFSEELTIHYAMIESSMIRISIIDLSGRELALISEDVYQSGHQEVFYHADDLGAGIYFLKMETDRGFVVRKIILSR